MTLEIKSFINLRVQIVLFLLYRFLLDVCFYFYLDEYYRFGGFILDFSATKWITSIVVIYCLFLFLPKGNKPSSILAQFVFLMTYVPTTSYFSLSNESWSWFFIVSIFWIIVSAILKLPNKIDSIRSHFTFVKEDILIVVILLTAFSFAILFYFGDFRFNLNIYRVYEIRAENPLGEVPFAGYFVNWTAKVFLPFLIIYFFVKAGLKLDVNTILAILSAILLFSITGHKSYLFLVPMAIGCAYLIKSGKFYINFLLVLNSIIILALLLLFLLGDQTLLTLLVRRSLFLPAQISFYYHDFFEGNQLFLSHSILHPFYEYPFDKYYAQKIASIYMGSDDANANNGIISDGYANFGVYGVMIWAILFAYIIKLIDYITNNKNKVLLVSLFLVSFKSFTDGALFTSLLTHGVLIAILIAFLYPVNKS